MKDKNAGRFSVEQCFKALGLGDGAVAASITPTTPETIAGLNAGVARFNEFNDAYISAIRKVEAALAEERDGGGPISIEFTEDEARALLRFIDSQEGGRHPSVRAAIEKALGEAKT